MNLGDIPDWVHWLAQDADGTWWGYEVEPLQHDHGWYENEVGRHLRLPSLTERMARPGDWRYSLQRVQRSDTGISTWNDKDQ